MNKTADSLVMIETWASMEDLKSHGAGPAVTSGKVDGIGTLLIVSFTHCDIGLVPAREKNKDLIAKPAEILICSPADPSGPTGPKK